MSEIKSLNLTLNNLSNKINVASMAGNPNVPITEKFRILQEEHLGLQQEHLSLQGLYIELQSQMLHLQHQMITEIPNQEFRLSSKHMIKAKRKN